MKPSEDQIKQALHHPDQIVRDAALQYYALSFSRDRSVMPLAVKAIEQYGWEEAFYYTFLLQQLPQTDETLLWLVGQLTEPHRLPQSAVERMQSIISHADAELLGRHEARLGECPLNGRTRSAMRAKIQLLSVSGETCWKELQDLCERHKDNHDSQRFEFDRANRLVEAISREGGRHADKVLSVLSTKLETFESNPLAWLEIFAAKLAGLIRLESAAPLLAAKLKDDDGDFTNEECAYALTRIGTDAAVDAIATDFHSAPEHYRLYASSALRDMRGDKAVATALELLKGKEDWDTQVKFIGTALANFDPEGLRVAREFGVDDLPQLRRNLIATAILTGEDFPKLEQLRQDEREHRAEVHRRQDWLSAISLPATKPRAAFQTAGPAIQPIKSGKRVGRNDPCPCGSGKKYKKCCMDMG